MEDRVLLLALRGRDAQVLEQLLTRMGHPCAAAHSANALAAELAEGAGAAVVTEESLAETGLGDLAAWLDEQPSWSDFPFILLATRRSGRRTASARRNLEQLGNVVVLERPIHGETLTRAVASALRGRRRQYEARGQLQALRAAEERLRQLNATLEDRISQRTRELALANDQLTQEIAERERAQAALVQSQKMEAVGQLTGGIAHDFNNLLTVISGNLELIERRADSQKVAAQAAYALEAVDRASKLTRQLLAFSRTQRLSLKPVDIAALVGGMDDLMNRTLGPLFRLDLDIADGAGWAMADANQVELAILNLAINARDAMPRGGTLRLSVARRPGGPPALDPGEYVVVAVSDEGTGIPPTLLDKVFDPFFSTKPIGKGTGLGLSQVYGIARQSGGTARIDSVQGQGTTVEIWLPAAAATALAPPSPARTAPGRVNGRERVMVVEDDPGVRRFMVESLQLMGYAVSEAANGHEGLERLAAERPALLIVDYAMPGMNGVEVVRAARLGAPDLPVILATGYADMEAVYEVVGADHVLRKPFQVDDLERAARSALSGRPASALHGPDHA